MKIESDYYWEFFYKEIIDFTNNPINSFHCIIFADIQEAHKNHHICSLIGVEGGHSLGGSLGVLRIYYSLGVRYMTLTSTCHTPWADSSNADAPKFDVKHGGLTNYGKVRRILILYIDLKLFMAKELLVVIQFELIRVNI